MEAVLKWNEIDTVEACWKVLSSLSRTAKLSLASKLTNSVLEEEMSDESNSHPRAAKVHRKAYPSLSDAELEARFAHLEMPQEPDGDASWHDVVKANSGRTIKSIEKWL